MLRRRDAAQRPEAFAAAAGHDAGVGFAHAGEFTGVRVGRHYFRHLRSYL